MAASAACSNPHVFAHTLRFSARGFLALTKNAWFLEVPFFIVKVKKWISLFEKSPWSRPAKGPQVWSERRVSSIKIGISHTKGHIITPQILGTTVITPDDEDIRLAAMALMGMTVIMTMRPMKKAVRKENFEHLMRHISRELITPFHVGAVEDHRYKYL